MHTHTYWKISHVIVWDNDIYVFYANMFFRSNHILMGTGWKRTFSMLGDKLSYTLQQVAWCYVGISGNPISHILN